MGTTFVMSAICRHDHKFDMVDIQNATLAGGVAVGSASDLVISPWAAILIGCIGGAVSVLGYTRLQPWLQAQRFLHDTCGVHNLHGMPGVLGGLSGTISAAVAGEKSYGQDIGTIWAARAASGDNRSAGEQAGFQFAALTLTVGISIFGGLLTGAIVNCMRGSVDEGPAHPFHDGDYWEGVSDLEGAPSSLQFEDGPTAYQVQVHPAPQEQATQAAATVDLVSSAPAPPKATALPPLLPTMQKLPDLPPNAGEP